MPVWTLGFELIQIGYKNFFSSDSIPINSNQFLCSVDRPLYITSHPGLQNFG